MNGTRIPPHNVDAEAAVLSAVMLDTSGSKLDEVRAIVSSQTFYAEAHKRIFDAICEIADQGEKVDVVTVAQRLRATGRDKHVGGIQYLAQITDATPAIANVAEHARILREHFRVRQAIALAQKRAAEGYSTPTDAQSVQKWLEDWEAELAELTHVNEQRMLVPLVDVLDETRSVLHSIRHGGAAGVPSGFTLVDAQTTGLHDGDLYIVAGRPGMGKSGYGLSIAARIADAGYAVAIFSLEMPRVQLGMRLLAMDARVNLKTLREGKLSYTEQTQLDLSLKALRDSPLFLDDSAIITSLEIKARVKKLQRELDAGKHPGATQRRIGAVVVDYLQLVRPTRESHSREQEVASIGRDLKQLAKTLGVPVIALCQLNREVEKRTDKRPQLSDLRESGAIEQEADAIFFIYRPSYYDRTNDPALKGWAEIIVAKQRNGPTGTVKVAFREDCTRFDNLEPGDVGVYEPTQASWYERNDDVDDQFG